ncbi:unannotated protein [freshwater metagenome]|uniref:Unannotated protein n=1 Tax=freshwater metagenome TaxID=449393 RepID=A0A6J6KMS7_9ZZZZ
MAHQRHSPFPAFRSTAPSALFALRSALTVSGFRTPPTKRVRKASSKSLLLVVHLARTTSPSRWWKPAAPKLSGPRCRTVPRRSTKPNSPEALKLRSSTSFSRSQHRTNLLPRLERKSRWPTRSALTTHPKSLRQCRASVSRSSPPRLSRTRPPALKLKQRFAISLLPNLLRSSPTWMVPTSNSRLRSVRSPRLLFVHAS